MPCAIWGTEAPERKTTGDYREINSPRAGGWYLVTGSVEPHISTLSTQGKKALTRWLNKQHALGWRCRRSPPPPSGLQKLCRRLGSVKRSMPDDGPNSVLSDPNGTTSACIGQSLIGSVLFSSSIYLRHLRQTRLPSSPDHLQKARVAECSVPR
jgi:hypothetical protein